MGNYPECDQYECPECPRRSDCVDRDWDEELDEEYDNSTAAADAFLDYIENRLSELEDQLAHLRRFEERVMRIIAAVIKTSETEED